MSDKQQTTSNTQQATTLDRYARHHLLAGWDQARLANARVLVAGVGAVGNEVVKLLALMGVGHLILVDFDRIEISNLTRSVLFRGSDVGQGKADVAAERAHALNPDVAARAIQGHLEFDVGLGVYRACDVVIGCLDSINARLALNRVCLRAGVPWLNTGIEATVAEIALYGSDTTDPNNMILQISGENDADTQDAAPSACFECAMSPDMWERRNQRFSCGGLSADLPENAVPTTATVASLAAAFAVNEALLLLHGAKRGKKEKGERRKAEERETDTFSFLLSPFSSGLEYGQKLFLNIAPYGLQTVNLPYNKECLAHERYEPVRVIAECATDMTPAQLLTREGASGGVVELGYDLLTCMRCLTCGRVEEILRPLEACSLALNHCPHCGTPTRTPTTTAWLDIDSPLAHRTLAALGVPEHQVLTIKDDSGRQYVQISGRLGAAA